MANFIFDTFKRYLVEQNGATDKFGLETDASGDCLVDTGDKIGVSLTTGACTIANCSNLASMSALIADGDAEYVEVLNSVTGYTTGGQVVANCGWELSSGSYVNALSFAYLRGDDVAWSGLGLVTDLPIKGAVLYYADSGALGDDSDDIPIAYFDFEAQPDGSNLTLQWGALPGAEAPTGGQGVILKLA